MIPAARVGTLTWRARDPFLWRALARNLLPAKDGYGDGLRHALTAGRHVISFAQARDGRAFTSAGWTRANPDLIGRRVQGCSNIRGPKSISNGGSIEVTFHRKVSGTTLTGTTDLTSRGSSAQ
jgi:hypothetical protein